MLWLELDSTLTGPPSVSPEVFAPDFCDLREELKWPNSEPLAEVVQHLRDLGYLGAELDDDKNELALGPGDEQPLTDALVAYYLDQDRFEDLFDYHSSPGESGEPKNVFRDEVLLERLKQPLVVKFDTIARLRALTSLDGQVDFRSEPELGEISLRTRVLHHLLRVYGVLPKDLEPSTAYGDRSLRALRSLRSLKGLKADEVTVLRIMNGLNKFDVVAEAFAKQFEDSSLQIPAPNSRNDWTQSLQKQAEAMLESKLPNRAVEVKAFQQDAVADWPPPSWNLFGVRFLQVFLWHRGYYFGELDGLWGELSQAAFISALEAHELPVKPLKNWWDRKQPGFWMEWDDYYCMDVSAFVRACNPRPGTAETKTPDEIFEMQQAIDEKLKPLCTTEEQAKEAWTDILNAASGDQEWTKKRRRRNFSLGMIGRGIQRILDFVKKVANSLKEFIKDLVTTIRGAVRQAFLYLRRTFRTALNTAKLAARRVIRMLTGTPFVYTSTETRWVLTKFSFDQDAVTLGSAEVQAQDVEAHFMRIREENRALDVVFRLGLKVLEIASAFTPPVAGFQAVRLAWRVLRAVWDLFRSLQTPKEKGPPQWRTGMLLAT